MKMGDCAIRYLNRGFAVVPAQGKRPIIDWRKYQEVRPTEAEVTSWWERFPNANIALVTGAVSGVVVVDVDGVTGEKFTPTAIVESSPDIFTTTTNILVAWCLARQVWSHRGSTFVVMGEW